MAMRTSSVFSSFGAPTRTRAAKSEPQAMQTLQSLNQHFRLTLNAYILNNWVHSHAESLVSNVRARFLGQGTNAASSPRETQQKHPVPFKQDENTTRGWAEPSDAQMSQTLGPLLDIQKPRSPHHVIGDTLSCSAIFHKVCRDHHTVTGNPKQRSKKTQNRGE